MMTPLLTATKTILSVLLILTMASGVAGENNLPAGSERTTDIHRQSFTLSYPHPVTLSGDETEQIRALVAQLERSQKEDSSQRLAHYFSQTRWQENESKAYKQLEILLDEVRQHNRYSVQKVITDYFRPWFAKDDGKVAFLYLYAAAGNYFYFSEFEPLWSLFQPILPYMRRVHATDGRAKDALATTFFYYAQVLNRKSRPKEALAELFKAEKIYQSLSADHPQLFRIYAVIGETWLEIKDYAMAEQYIRKGLKNFPADRMDARGYVSALLARALTRQNKHQQALHELREYFKNPVDQRADYRLFIFDVYAEVLANNGDLDDALVVAKKALTLAKEHQNQDILNQANFRLGKIYLQQAHYDQAKRYLEAAVDAPLESRGYKSPEMYLLLVELLKKKGDYKQALRRFEEYQAMADSERDALDKAKIRDLEISRKFEQVSAQNQRQQLALKLVQEKEIRARETTRWLIWVLLLATVIILIIAALLVIIRRSRKQFEQLSNEDPLTGLKNRRFVDQFMQMEAPRLIRDQSFVGVVLIDIDFFKQINDEFGHETGDQILITFARFLRQSRREEDVICRWGGEEFLLICRIEEPWALENICRQIHRALAGRTLTQKNIRLTISMGAGVFPPPQQRSDKDSERHWQTDWQQLLQQIDSALYEVKQAGRNNWKLV